MEKVIGVQKEEKIIERKITIHTNKHKAIVKLELRRVYIEDDNGNLVKGIFKDWNLNPIDEYIELSITGDIYDKSVSHKTPVAFGQVREEVAKIRKNILSGKEKVLRIIIDGKTTTAENKLHHFILNTLNHILWLWDRYHLNGLRAGTQKQTLALRKANLIDVNYHKQVEFLKKEGLYEDNGYKYGQAWLVEPLPEDVIELVKSLP